MSATSTAPTGFQATLERLDVVTDKLRPVVGSYWLALDRPTRWIWFMDDERFDVE
jgi:hypothetical protein